MGVSAMTTVGMTLSYTNCLVFTDLDDQALMSAHASFQTSFELTLGVRGLFEVTASASGEVALNLDPNSDGLATPGAVLRSFIEQSCPYEEGDLFAAQAMDWQLGIKTSMSITISLYDGVVEYEVPASVDALLWVSSSAWAKDLSVEVRLAGPQGLAEMLGSQDLAYALTSGESFLGSSAQFVCSMLASLGVSERMNPLCTDFAYWGREMLVKATMSSPAGGRVSAHVQVTFGEHSMSFERGDSGYTFCINGQCSSVCSADSDCAPGWHCCHSTGDFSCQRVWTACCGYSGFLSSSSCLRNGEINANSGACPSGYYPDKLTCANADDYCKDLNLARPVDSCTSNDHVGTCGGYWSTSCDDDRGWTTCEDDECKCARGCPDSEGAKCVDAHGSTIFEGTINCFKEPLTTETTGTCQSKSLAVGRTLQARQLENVPSRPAPEPTPRPTSPTPRPSSPTPYYSPTPYAPTPWSSNPTPRPSSPTPRSSNPTPRPTNPTPSTATTKDWEVDDAFQPSYTLPALTLLTLAAMRD